jgi:hypothetical protein
MLTGPLLEPHDMPFSLRHSLSLTPLIKFKASVAYSLFADELVIYPAIEGEEPPTRPTLVLNRLDLMLAI